MFLFFSLFFITFTFVCTSYTYALLKVSLQNNDTSTNIDSENIFSAVGCNFRKWLNGINEGLLDYLQSKNAREIEWLTKKTLNKEIQVKKKKTENKFRRNNITETMKNNCL